MDILTGITQNTYQNAERRAGEVKKKKMNFPNIPPVPGVVYYITIKGKNRSIICTEFDAEKKVVYLSDLKTGYEYRWKWAHFSFNLRKCSWKDPQRPSGDYTVEVIHSMKKEDFGENSRNYTKENLDALLFSNIDDLDKVLNDC